MRKKNAQNYMLNKSSVYVTGNKCNQEFHVIPEI